MAQIPDIKTEVNREPDRDKKRAGLFARLFGGGSVSGSFGGGSGGLAGGGMMATKAGMLALILVGTTVAGGIGVVGYRFFGPGSDDNAEKNFTLFAARPKDKAAADGASSAAPKDVNSQSLTMFNKANTAANAAEAKPADGAAGSDVAGASGSGASRVCSEGHARQHGRVRRVAGPDVRGDRR